MTTEKILTSFTNRQKGYKKNEYRLVKHTEDNGEVTFIIRQKIGGTTQYVGGYKNFERAKATYTERFNILTRNLGF